VKNSISGIRITNSTIDSVRGFGVRLESVSSGLVRGLIIVGVDSLGSEEGAGIKLVSGNATNSFANLVRNANVGVLATGTTNARVDTNIVWRNITGMRIVGGATSSVAFNDLFDNTADTIPIGLVNPGGSSLTMSNNWWGDSRGPRQSGTPLATGDSVVGAVTVGTLRASPLFNGGTAAALRIVRGNNQTGVQGTALAQAFTVRVVDAGGLPVNNVQVVFNVVGGGGNVSPGNATSNTSGLVETTLTLGSAPGANTVVATITVSGIVIAAAIFTATGT